MLTKSSYYKFIPPIYSFSTRTTRPDQANPNLEKRQQTFSYAKFTWRLAFWTSIGLFTYNWYLLNKSDAPQEQIGYLQPFSEAASYWQNSYQSLYDFITKPPIDKLLGDIPPLPYGVEIPKTLVINLTGTFLHTDFVFGKGAEILKRPGLQKFLKKLSQQYELVVLTDDDTMFVQGICEKLDPQHMMFAGRFGRESHVLEGKHYIKDLKYLNRPLHRIIVVDHNKERLEKYQENGIFIDKFEGNEEDNTLNELLPLLEYLGRPQVRDVRKELKKFGNVNPQEKFMQNLREREQKMQQNMKTGMMGMLDRMANQKQQKRF